MSSAAAAEEATNLPVPLTRLVGREREVAAAAALLLDGELRLLTLTGPGGVGKTRLALQVAAEAGDRFADGVCFVPLAAVTHRALVVPAIAQAFGVRAAGNVPLLEALVRFLRGRDLLLVLDNFEHVAAAAPAVAGLLARCPRLRALVTSRMHLLVEGEQEFSVPPLAYPDPSALRSPSPSDVAGCAAVALFVARARAVNPGFALTEGNAAAVAEVCARLDGLPLAIELAAARSKVLSPQALLARLSKRLTLLTAGGYDRPARQQTLRDTIGWSYDLLAPEDQALFRRLAVCVGGFGLELAEAVAGEERGKVQGPSGADASASVTPNHEAFPSSILDGLQRLVDHSLVRPEDGPPSADGAGTEPRFAMLETIREYGLDRLEASGEAPEARRRHAAWCLALGEEAWAALSLRTNTDLAFGRFAGELGNIRAALSWLDETGSTVECLELVGGLTWLWYYWDHWREGRALLERALARAVDAPAAVRARALFGAALLSHYLGDDERTDALAEESLDLCRQLGDPRGVASALFILGVAAEDRGDYARAVPFFEEARELFDRIGEAYNAVLTTYHLGIVAYGRGDAAEATALLEEALAHWRETDDARGKGAALSYLGFVAGNGSDEARAVACFAEGLALCDRPTAQQALNFGLLGLGIGALAVSSGQPERATRLFGATAALTEPVGFRFALPERATYERAVQAARAVLGDQAFAAAWTAGEAMSSEQAVAEAAYLLAACAATGTRAAPAAAAIPTTALVPGVGFGLTARELEVLRLLARGLSNPQIADALSISRKTASHHVESILAKLGVESRAAAAGHAVRHGLV